MKRHIFIATLLLLAVSFSGCKKVLFKPQPSSDPVAVFDYLWKDFKENYGPTEARHVNWDSLYTVYRPQIDANSSDDALFKAMSQMLKTLNDGHVNLTAPDRINFASNLYYRTKLEDSLFSMELVDKYLDAGYSAAEDNGYTYGTIKGEVGYVHFRYIGDNMFILPELLDKFADKKGLIIDLRHNHGGDFTYAFSEMGRLVDKERKVFSSRTKSGPGPNDWTAWYDWSLKPETPYFDKKIVLLTDRYTISAGERATMAFKVLPNVVHIGDSTNGAHSTMIGRELANGWYYTIPPQQVYFADGKTYEGIGMIPDILKQNTLSEMRLAKDAVLDEAMKQF